MGQIGLVSQAALSASRPQQIILIGYLQKQETKVLR